MESIEDLATTGHMCALGRSPGQRETRQSVGENRIIHKTLVEQTTGLTGQAALAKREKLREKVEAFIADELKAEDAVAITETAITAGGLLSVTVWYRSSGSL